MRSVFICLFCVLFLSGCYVSYPSVGRGVYIAPHTRTYVKKCKYDYYADRWICRKVWRRSY